MTKSKPSATDDTIRVIPLGGIDKIGMNMTAIEFKDTIVVIDCGAMFADDVYPDAEKFVPDITFLEDNADKVKALLITHGHEDHIGALPFFLNILNIPVYGTKFTIELIRSKLEENYALKNYKLHTVKYKDVIKIGDFSFEYIKVNHSIPESAAIALTCDIGTVVHTGDFKVDFTPVNGDIIDLHRFAELGNAGVLAVLSDSTNALRAGFSQSESCAGADLEKVFKEYADHRLIVSTFASNIDRICQIMNLAQKYKRNVITDGRAINAMIPLARKLNYLSVDNTALIDYPEDETIDEHSLFLVTGSQGEPNASLAKMANSKNENISINYHDVVVFSASVIPGNEKPVSVLKNKLTYLGAEIPEGKFHSTGHAYADEIKLIYSLLKPKYIVPIHGEFIHRNAACKLAQSMGYSPLKTALLPDNGYVLDITEKKATVKGRIQTGCLAISDGCIIRAFHTNGILKM